MRYYLTHCEHFQLLSILNIDQELPKNLQTRRIIRRAVALETINQKDNPLLLALFNVRGIGYLGIDTSQIWILRSNNFFSVDSLVVGVLFHLSETLLQLNPDHKENWQHQSELDNTLSKYEIDHGHRLLRDDFDTAIFNHQYGSSFDIFDPDQD